MNLLWGGMILVGILWCGNGKSGRGDGSGSGFGKRGGKFMCCDGRGNLALGGTYENCGKIGTDSPDYGENGTFSAFSLFLKFPGNILPGST